MPAEPTHRRFGELAGGLQLRPGPAGPHISSTRRDWATLLATGRPATEVPDLLAGLFALCGDAHRHAARWALAAAENRLGAFEANAPAQAAMREAVRADTVREHLRRLWLDWPRLLGSSDSAAPIGGSLAACPLLRPGGSVAAARPWIEPQVFGMPVEAWIEQWRADGEAFVRRWAAQGAAAAARHLHAAWPLAGSWRTTMLPLHVHADPDPLRALAAHWQATPGFALQPHWQGQPAETGPWTRWADRKAMPLSSPMSAWWRLASRVCDLAALMVEGGEQRLAMGGLALAAGSGLGWCEMARGLLLHHAIVDGGGRVQHWSVLAPTEWNFHPEGALAGWLAQSSADVPAASVQLLAGCFDPCVPVQVVSTAAP